MIMIMLKYWRELLIIALLIVFVLLLNRFNAAKSDNKLLTAALDKSYTTVQYYKNKNGDLVGQVKMRDLTIDQLKNYADELLLDRDRIKKQVGRLENLVGYWKAEVSVADTFRVTLRDTVIVNSTGFDGDKYFNWSNDYLFLDGIINTEKNLLSIQYKYQFKFELTAYYKPKSFREKLTQPFKPKQLVADLYFNDPNLRATNFTGIVISSEPKKFYQTTGFKIGIGFLGGMLAANKL